MGCTPEAIDLFIEHKILYGPGKAVNAGGVSTSGLEMTQNAMHLSWPATEVDNRLHQIMSNIHDQCVKYGTQPDGYINYMKGANIAGFMKVAHAMMEPLNGTVLFDGDHAEAWIGSQMQINDRQAVAEVLGLAPDKVDFEVRAGTDSRIPAAGFLTVTDTGVYTIEVEVAGFRKAVSRDVLVSVDTH